MKLYKIFALGLAGLSLAACSNDKEEVTFNTLPGATVWMGDAGKIDTIEVKENGAMFNVPISVKGERNGCVQVTVAIREVGDNPAIEDGNFYITTKTLNIPADVDQANLEIVPVNNPEEDPDLTFEIAISDVKYATLEGPEYTLVKILEKGIAPTVDQIPNSWDGQALNDDDEVGKWRSNMSVEQPDSGSTYPNLIFDNFYNQGLNLTVQYTYNEKLLWGDFYIPFGKLMGSGNFSGIGQSDLYSASTSSSVDGGLDGKWNDDFTGIDFTGGLRVILYQNGVANGYYWFQVHDISFTAR